MATTIFLHPPPPPPPLSSFHRRHHNRTIPLKSDVDVLTEALKVSKSAEHTKEIHGRLTRANLSALPFPASGLIASYSKFPTPQSLSYALLCFQQLENRAVLNPGLALFLLNTLIRGFSSSSSSGSIATAIRLYHSIADRGLAPDCFTFPPLFAAFSRTPAAEAGAQLHCPLLKFGLGGSNMFLDNSLIHFYSEIGDLVSARRVFDGMPERNVVSWTSLIDGYARGEDPMEAVSLFLDMTVQEDSCSTNKPNSVTMACVISACAKLNDIALGERIAAYIARLGIELNVHLVNSLVDMYMKCGSVEKAERLFRDCADRSGVVLWNTMVTNYVRLGLAETGLALFNEMLVSGLRPDRVTIVGALSASGQLCELGFGRRLHGYVLRYGLDSCDAVSNAVIDMYMKCGDPDGAFVVFGLMEKRTEVSWNTIIFGCATNGDLDLARRCFELMPDKGLFSWNTMINALAKESCFKEVISLFHTMQGLGLRPDKVTMVSICTTCGFLGTLDLAKWVYAYIGKNRVECNLQLGTALVDMFAKCGDPKSAMEIFDGMPVRDVAAWTAAIGAVAVEGDGRRALELFDRMVGQGVEPDGVVFVAVLTALSHGGLVEEGLRFFRSMKEIYGFLPEIVHYGCMVDLLGRAGMLAEALAMIQAIPMEPNDVIWGSLLAACRNNRNIEMAEYAADKVLNLAPERCGIHVLLSNAYASAGKWEEVARVRLALKDKGIQKLPGSSFIEVDGVIHEFTSTCASHPQMTLIAGMIDEMSERLSSSGYVTDLADVFG